MLGPRDIEKIVEGLLNIKQHKKLLQRPRAACLP
jgi:hypothetical protein